MKKISLLSKCKLIVPAMFVTCFSAAHAVPSWVMSGGEVAGVNDLLVSGTAYDVRFHDGTCASVWGGCDTANFTFTTSFTARAASESLMTWYQLDPFNNNNPANTLGIESGLRGEIDTPWGTFLNPGNGLEYILDSTYINNSVAADSVNGSLWPYIGHNTTASSDRTWAQWNLASVSSVPETSTFLLLASGIAALGMTTRRRKRLS